VSEIWLGLKHILANEGAVKLARNKQSPYRTSIGNSDPCAHPEKTSASQVRWEQGRWRKQKKKYYKTY
jgi:hypothetical protein